jgi:hypothetical protein
MQIQRSKKVFSRYYKWVKYKGYYLNNYGILLNLLNESICLIYTSVKESKNKGV